MHNYYAMYNTVVSWLLGQMAKKCWQLRWFHNSTEANHVLEQGDMWGLECHRCVTQCRQMYSFTLIHAFCTLVKMARFLLRQSGVKYLLSERFCQDPVEAFFGKQRASGGRNDNPTVKQFLDNTVSLRVQGSSALDPVWGNCRRRKQHTEIHDETPLPKRKRK